MENSRSSGCPQDFVARKPGQTPLPFRPALLAGLSSHGGAVTDVTPGHWVTTALARRPFWRLDVVLHLMLTLTVCPIVRDSPQG